jgi:hypothetical protein
MHVIVDCLGCGRTFKTRDKYAGKRVECPACRRVIQIPRVGPAILAAAPVSPVPPPTALQPDAPPSSTPPPIVATVVTPEEDTPLAPATITGPPPLPPPRLPPTQGSDGPWAIQRDTPPPAHRLVHAPIGQFLLWNTLTFGVFGTIYLNLLHGRLPRTRPGDPSAGRAIGFLFIPFFNLYWVFFTYRRLVDRLDEQRACRGLPPTGLRDLATNLGIATVAAVLLWFLIIPGLVQWLLVLPLFLTRVLRDVNALVEMGAQPPADDAHAAADKSRVMAQADREYRRAWGGALYVWAALLLGLASIFALFAMVYGLSPGIQPPPEVDKLPGVICLLFFATLSAVPAVMAYRRGRRMRRSDTEI